MNKKNSFNFNKKGQLWGRFFAYVIPLIVFLVVIIGIAPQISSFFGGLDLEQDEQACKVFGNNLEDFTISEVSVFCTNSQNLTSEQSNNEEILRFICGVDSDEEIEIQGFDRVEFKNEIEDRIERNNCREDDLECTCIQQAFLAQEKYFNELIGGTTGSSGNTLGNIIGGGINQEENWLTTITNLFGSDKYKNSLSSGSDPLKYNFTAIYEPIDENHPILEPKVGSAFIRQVNLIANELETDPRFLISVMSFETGDSFDPCKKNLRSTATGLIQFLEATAQSLGTSTSALCSMGAVEQLEYVQRYYESCNRCSDNLGTIEQAYTAVFSGRAREGNEVIYSSPSDEYSANKELDTKLGNGDGTITVSEAAHPVKARYVYYFGDIIDRRLRESVTFTQPNSELLSQFTNSDGSPQAIGSNSPIWTSGQLHNSVTSRKDWILGYRNDEHRARVHTIFSNVLIATSEAAKYAESIGCTMIITSGNRWDVSDSHNHAQNGRTGNALDFILERNGVRCTAQEFAQVIFHAYNNGATEFGFGVSNGAGSHIGVSTAGGLRSNAGTFENSVPQWNYDSSGQTARNIFNDLVRESRQSPTVS